jgi:NitT/TauT family transport system ATP-binding protein
LQKEPAERKPVKIRIDHLDFSYADNKQSGPEIISDLNMQVFDQEFLTIVGASGCGKSTLLNIIAGLLPPGKGKAFINDREIEKPGPERAMVFQDDAVFPWFTVYENIEYGLKIAKMEKSQRELEVQRMLKLVGLTGFESFYPRQLSGGMRKRVDVARAIITKPEVLLMDEPFAALDVLTKQHLQEQFQQIWNDNRMTVVFVTHDLEEALYLADRVVVMSSHPGRIARTVEVPFGRPREKIMKTSSDFQALRRDLGMVLDGNPVDSLL